MLRALPLLSWFKKSAIIISTIIKKIAIKKKKMRNEAHACKCFVFKYFGAKMSAFMAKNFNGSIDYICTSVYIPPTYLYICGENER